MSNREILRVGSHANNYLHVVKRAATVVQIDAEIKALANSAKLPTALPRDC